MKQHTRKKWLRVVRPFALKKMGGHLKRNTMQPHLHLAKYMVVRHQATHYTFLLKFSATF